MKFMDMLKEKAGLPARKYAVIPAGALASACMAVPAFATEGSATVSASDWAPVIEAVTGQISVSSIIAALATFVLACIGLVFMWWGLRKGINSLMKAFRNGRLSI